ncbi:MAG TPA: HD domain-containing protein [Firmicutes bacterium]|nr:HD domain-containing protein [Bacillota bacterium]
MDLVQAASTYARDLLGGEEAPLWLHVKKVVEVCQQLAPPAHTDQEVLLLAAYLHDIGYATGPALDHERRSADMARQFLRDRGVPPDRVELVVQTILAHVFPVFGQERDNLSLEAKILYDADKLQRASGLAALGVIWEAARKDPDGSMAGFRSLLSQARKQQEQVYGSLYTDRARQLACEGYRAALNYIDALNRTL